MYTFSPHEGTISSNGWVAYLTLLWRHLFRSGQHASLSIFRTTLHDETNAKNYMDRKNVHLNGRIDSSVMKQHCKEPVILHVLKPAAGFVDARDLNLIRQHIIGQPTRFHSSENDDSHDSWKHHRLACWDAVDATVRAGLDAGKHCVCQLLNSTVLPVSSIERGWRRILWRRSQVVWLRQSPAEPRKEETRNKKRSEGERSVDGPAHPGRDAFCRAQRVRRQPTWRAPQRKITKRNYYGTSNGR